MSQKMRNKHQKNTHRSRSRLRQILYGFLLLWLLTFIWHQVKPMPEGTVASCQYHPMRDDQIRFVHDLTYKDKSGRSVNEQKIFDHIFSMIDQAQNFIMMDFFLLNQYKGEAGDVHRNLSTELVQRLIQRKQSIPHLQAVLITDPINIIYGGSASPLLTQLEAAGVEVVYTDLKRLRDSNPAYSAVWRILFQWFGNDTQTTWLSNPFQADAKKISLRSWLSLLNFKANHRKLIVADQPAGEVNALITSANPHDASSAHSNVAFYFTGNAAITMLKSELAVARFSGWEKPQSFHLPEMQPVENMSSAKLQTACTTEAEIRNTLVSWFDQTQKGDDIDIAVFYLSERKVIKSLISAAKRGVNIRLILDANKDAFGRKKNGIPNRSVAYELLQAGNGNIQVRWYETHGEQFHSKLTMVKLNQGLEPALFATLGSANYTRRNIGNFNLEANLAVKMSDDSQLATEMKLYFDKIWQNDGGVYTVDYANYSDESELRYWQYRFMEASGMSSF